MSDVTSILQAIERACASNPSDLARVTASGPMAAMLLASRPKIVVRFMKSSTDRPEEKRAVREVGKT